MALLLVTIIAAVVLAVASPSGRDTLAVLAFKFRLGALAVLVLARRVRFVATIPAIVSEVT